MLNFIKKIKNKNKLLTKENVARKWKLKFAAYVQKRPMPPPPTHLQEKGKPINRASLRVLGVARSLQLWKEFPRIFGASKPS
jgi:hypothetical protein